jgi:hypothetical protein
MEEGSPGFDSSDGIDVSLKSCKVAATLRPLPVEEEWGGLFSGMVADEAEAEELVEFDLLWFVRIDFAGEGKGEPAGKVMALLDIRENFVVMKGDVGCELGGEIGKRRLLEVSMLMWSTYIVL